MLKSSTVAGPIAASRRAMPARFLCGWRLGATGAVWVRIAGELGPTNSPQLAQTLMQAQLSAHLVVLDLRELTSIDSSGIRAILDAGDRGCRYAGRLTLVRGPGEVDRELTLNGVCDRMLVFDLHPAEPAETLLKADGSCAAAHTNRRRTLAEVLRVPSLDSRLPAPLATSGTARRSPLLSLHGRCKRRDRISHPGAVTP